MAHKKDPAIALLTRLTFRVDESTRKRIAELAAAARVTEGEIMRRAIEGYNPPGARPARPAPTSVPGNGTPRQDDGPRGAGA